MSLFIKNINSIGKKEYKYGEYKIYKIDDITDLVNLIKSKTMIIFDEENNQLKLKTSNMPLLIQYQIKEYTNLKDYIDIDDIGKIFNANNKNINKLLKELKNNIQAIVLNEKRILEKQNKEVKNNIKKVEKLRNKLYSYILE